MMAQQGRAVRFPGQAGPVCWLAFDSLRTDAIMTLLEGLALLTIGTLAGFINVLAAGARC